MVRDLLITLAADPRQSSRAGEAVRIAAGVGAWNKVKVHLHLKGPAVLCADEFADELLNGHLFIEYLPAVLSHGGRIFTEETNPEIGNIRPAIKFERLSVEEIQAFQRGVDHEMTFT